LEKKPQLLVPKYVFLTPVGEGGEKELWYECPFTGEECGRLRQGFSCVVGTTHGMVRNLKSICRLPDEEIQKLIVAGEVEEPFLPDI